MEKHTDPMLLCRCEKNREETRKNLEEPGKTNVNVNVNANDKYIPPHTGGGRRCVAGKQFWRILTGSS